MERFCLHGKLSFTPYYNVSMLIVYGLKKNKFSSYVNNISGHIKQILIRQKKLLILPFWTSH